MNIQHNADSGERYTPKEWIDAVKEVFIGCIDLDPCSSAKANTIVGARRFFTAKDNGLEKSWGHEFGGGIPRVFYNAPGCCPRLPESEQYPKGLFTVCGGVKGKCSCKLPQKFLAKAFSEVMSDPKMSVINLAYSVNHIRQLTALKPHAGLAISIALPPSRIKFLDPDTLEPMGSPPMDSAFFLITKDPRSYHKTFKMVFSNRGCEVYTRA